MHLSPLGVVVAVVGNCRKGTYSIECCPIG
jgi:hypothetical protein